jgi:hypothetical protein
VQSCLQGLKGDLRYYTTAMFADDLNQVLSELQSRHAWCAKRGVTEQHKQSRRSPAR